VPFLQELAECGVVAVIRGDSAEGAVEICDALLRGGITGLEITYTTPDCCRAIEMVRSRHGDAALLGVGTVTSIQQLQDAAAAGASFAVSPHFQADIVEAAVAREIPILPGALTPTEIMTAWTAGAAAVKLFPGSAVGPSFVKAVRAPLPDIPLMPTGGGSLGNMAEWFQAGVVAVGMGGKLAAGRPAQIEAAARAVSAELKRVQAHGKLPTVKL
jgi:2-dehydro-3-deoxyphosphogluconate aldolase/(4S)-4-hydroxy-2-oxoglutarate aldolase